MNLIEELSNLIDKSTNNLLKYDSKLNRASLKSDLNKIKVCLKEDLNNTKTVINKTIQTEYGNGIDFVDRSSHKKTKIRAYVLIPINTASDAQAERCLMSIIDNFDISSIAIIAISNRRLTFIDQIKDRGINIQIIYRLSGFSLPQAYNTMVQYVKKDDQDPNKVLIFMDDDAEILPNQTDKINKNIELVENDRFIATSGSYYDIRKSESFIFNAINYSNTYSFKSRVEKPYTHGGAILTMKISSFPSEGLTESGLGGINLSINFARIFDQKRLEKGEWFMHHNHDIKVHHPAKDSLLQWSATYMSYKKAWSSGIAALPKTQQKIFYSKLSNCSKKRIETLVEDYNDHKSLHSLANLLMTKYYKNLVSSNIQYTDFKDYKLRLHVNYAN